MTLSDSTWWSRAIWPVMVVLMGCGSNGASIGDAGADVASSGGRPGTGGVAGAGNVGQGGDVGFEGTGGTTGGAGGMATSAGGAVAPGGTGGRVGSAGMSGATGSGGLGGSGIAGNLGGSGGTAGASATTGGRGGVGGVGSGGTNSAGGAGGAVGPGKLGVIIVQQNSQVVPTLGAIVGAGASAVFGAKASASSCQETAVGDCKLFQCAPPSGGTPPPSPYLQAGTVTIAGLSTNVPLTYSATPGSYISASYPSYLWTTSRQATVTVSGSANVPAFSLSVTAPNPISVTSPVPQSNSTYTISRASDLKVTWTGGVEGMVGVALSSGNTVPGSVSVQCFANASTGTLLVPATLLSNLGASGGFSAGVTNVAKMNISDWTMQFQASTQKDQGTATFSN